MSSDEGDLEYCISVVGLGYVGLPAALAFYDAGVNIYGIDISEEVINLLKNGINPLIDNKFKPKIPLSNARWNVTTNYAEAIPHSDIVLITVPTPVNKDKTPDLSYIEAAAKSVLNNINPDKLTIVVLESTVYPGVTKKILGGICQELDLTLGKEIILAYCPERVSPGDEFHSVDSVARVVGCDDEKVGVMLANLYSRITSEISVYVGDIEVAEAAKMVENLQRDIDIALSNELALILPLMGIDVEEVLQAAETKWNFHRHTPGIGVGGHCIPVDPYYYISLSEKLGFKSLLSPIARGLNEGMPSFTVESIKSLLPSGLKNSKILILGYSYKPELGDTRETPVYDLIELLSKNDSNVFVYDPFVDSKNMPKWINHISDIYSIKDFDMIILATAHNDCLELDWTKLLQCCPNTLIYDGRRALEKDKMREIGWNYFGTGMPLNKPKK